MEWRGDLCFRICMAWCQYRLVDVFVRGKPGVTSSGPLSLWMSRCTSFMVEPKSVTNAPAKTCASGSWQLILLKGAIWGIEAVLSGSAGWSCRWTFPRSGVKYDSEDGCSLVSFTLLDVTLQKEKSSWIARLPITQKYLKIRSTVWKMLDYFSLQLRVNRWYVLITFSGFDDLSLHLFRKIDTYWRITASDGVAT